MMASRVNPSPSRHSARLEEFLPSGKLWIGANYWASHAGTSMWSNWKPEIVKQDFSLLAAGGIQGLRVFPLWPDFQPIHCLRRDNGQIVEFRFGEHSLPADSDGQHGVSTVMLDRLELLCDLAQAQGLDLIVGLVTGWMSGRLFMPPGLEGRNPITDPLCLMWQVRLIESIVTRLRAHPALRAWDLGNECNCLGPATREQAWVWTHALSGAIRSNDPFRPILSGMHGLPVTPDAPWSIQDQAERTDGLTTHPYPLFTAHCNREPLNTQRPLLHATAETRLYADISGKAAFVEEMGNFGPAFCGERVAADCIRAQLFSLWAHDCRAALWWCAHDQTALEGAPYDWISMERELGLLRPDRTPKPVFAEMDKVRRALEGLPLKQLPMRRVEAVCILSEGQDQWGAAFSAFLLAKQAGFDLRFHWGANPLPDSPLYLLPSIKGLRTLSRQSEIELQERVRAGATLYVSAEDGFLGVITAMTGLEVMGRYERAGACTFQLKGSPDIFTLEAPVQFDVLPGQAEILAEEENGQPLFSVARYGAGEVYFLGAPLETSLAKMRGAFLATSKPYSRIYEIFARKQIADRHIRKSSPWLGITEHPLFDGGLVAVLINYLPAPLECTLEFSDAFVFREGWLGNPPLPGKSSPFQLAPHAVAIWHFSPA